MSSKMPAITAPTIEGEAKVVCNGDIVLIAVKLRQDPPVSSTGKTMVMASWGEAVAHRGVSAIVRGTVTIKADADLN